MNLQYLGTIAGFLEFTKRLALQTEKSFAYKFRDFSKERFPMNISISSDTTPRSQLKVNSLSGGEYVASIFKVKE
jgi:hypothetical protein